MKSFLALFFALIFPASLAAQNVNIPDSYGQVWKQYDISAYTSRFPQMSRPESAVADWILMETGFEAWHSEIPAMLNVTNRTL